MTNNTQPSQQVPSNADLELIIECNPSMLLATIKEKTAFDARLMAIVFDLAKAHVRTLLAQSPAASDAGLADDGKRLAYVLQHGAPMMRDFMYRYPCTGSFDWYESPEDAIDAALASQEPQHG